LFGLSSGPFTGFEAKDFDAFEPRKWSNHRFNLERMRVRDKLGALKRLTDEAYERAGVPMLSELTLDHPHILNNNRVDAIWLFFSRAEAQRKELARFIERETSLAELVSDPNPQNQHLLMGLRVYDEGIEVLMRLHRHAALDVRNWCEKLGDAWEADNFKALAAQVPERFCLRLGDDERPVSELVTMGGKGLRAFFDEGGASLRIRTLLPRDDEIVGQAELSDALLEALNALLPIYRYAAWTPENDFISIKKLLKKERRAAPQPAPAPAKAQRPAATSPATPTRPGRARPERPLAKGAKVRITAGLFSGKEGSVVEVDARGRVKLLLGKMAVTLTPRELKVL
jgi:hypothetical protein